MSKRHDQAEGKLDQIIASLAQPAIELPIRDAGISGPGIEAAIEQSSDGVNERELLSDRSSLLAEAGSMEPADAQSANDPSAALLDSLVTWRTSAVTWISLELRRCNPCMGVCGCVCHTHRTLQTPQNLHRLMGNLLIGYAGMSLWRPKCDVPSCCGYWAKAVKINYCFPQWFVARAVQLTWHNCFGGPEFEVSLQRRLPEFMENSVFVLAHAGNSEAVKTLLTHRKIMPNDAEATRGRTPLHVRFLEPTDDFFIS